MEGRYRCIAHGSGCVRKRWETVQQYVDDGKEIKEGYKFYLSDSDWNYTGGFRPEFDEDCMYQTIRVANN